MEESSILVSLSGEYGGPRTPSYACAKMGLMALTHNLARFLGPRNICVNTSVTWCYRK